MTARRFLQLLRRHWLLLVLVPLTTAASIYFFSRFQDRRYKSETVIYTGIASGYKIAGGNDAAGNAWNATSTAFDNLLALINSRDTRREVCLHLLAWRLQHDAQAGGPEAGAQAFEGKSAGYARLPAAYRARLTGPTLAATLANVTAAYRYGDPDPVFRLIDSKDPQFSETALQSVVAGRVKDSDLVQIEYTTTDPLLCQKSLEILTQIFVRKHQQVFSGQNESVVGYFDKATQTAYQRLQTAEQKLLDFHQKHNIVDYDKQIVASTDEKQLSADKYNALEMQYAGAFSTLKTLESTLNKRAGNAGKGQDIIRLRSQLSGLNNQIAELELVGNTVPGAPARLAALRQQAEQLNSRMNESVNGEYANSHSTRGVAVKELLSDYNKSSQQVEDLKSQLSLMRQQKQVLAGQYNALVPLGAEIRKIRREVEVAEKEYLAQMEGLKQSKLSQQNSVLAAQLRVVDPPYLPSNSNGPRLLLLLVGGFVGAFFLTGAGLVTASMLSSALRDPANAASITSFPVAGVIPRPGGGSAAEQRARAKRAENHLARHLLLKFPGKADADQPYTIGVLSSHCGEGKTQICGSLATSLREMGIKTLSLFPADHAAHIMPTDDTRFYAPLQGLAPGTTIAGLAGHRLLPTTVVIVEFPALLETPYPASLLQSLDLILVAVQADRAWQPADRQVFQSIRAVTKAPIELVLNGVLPEYVADFIGRRVRPMLPAYEPALPPHPPQALLR